MKSSNQNKNTKNTDTNDAEQRSLKEVPNTKNTDTNDAEQFCPVGDAKLGAGAIVAKPNIGLGIQILLPYNFTFGATQQKKLKHIYCLTGVRCSATML